jgi:GNAT superfamily N-acetyltransferase
MALIFEQADARRGEKPIPQEVQRQEDIERFKRRTSVDGSWSRIVMAHDRPVGFVVGFPTYDATNNRYLDDTEHLGDVMVAPDYWGKGIAGGLLDWAAELNRAKGKKHIELWTQKDNTRSRELYERKGYRLTGAEKVHEEFGEEIVQYQLDL